jgi:hypothetical protein
MFWMLFFFVSATAHAKPYFAVSDRDVRLAQCQRARPWTEDEMAAWLTAASKDDEATVSTARPVTVFGIKLTSEGPYLASLLEKLLAIDPVMRTPQPTYDSHCTQALCASQDLFGPRVGLRLLFMLGKYGFNGSHLRVQNADAWTAEELDVVLLALSDLPPHLIHRPRSAMNHSLVHVKRTDASENRPLANAIIQVFNGWNQLTPATQRYVVFHELGHNMGFDFGFDDARTWYEVSEWSERGFEWRSAHPETKVSGYAQTGPGEDFAESFATYRYGPARLKSLNPKLYQFMKKKVFQNLEYLSPADCR